ncbi:pyridoxal phosphate homeostasis protein-like isoform X2 [Halichondria panicea]
MKIQWAYNQGLRHFGENYVQELESKARYLHNHTNCTDIKWHFIGHLQSKKAKLLTNIPGMWMVETLDSLKLANKLNSYWGLRENGSHLLKVLVQVNTSKEESKHGCMPEESVDLVQYVMENCENLDFKGLMTIGQMGHSYDERGSNPDFLRLVDCHDKVKKLLKIHRPLELSMGMSGDYEHAIEHGSTSVRVGTALFGPRDD